MTEIATLDPHDDRALRDWFAAEQASLWNDRPRAVTRTFGALANGIRNPNPYVGRTLLAARENGVTVGVGELELSLRDNLHLAQMAVHVVPGHRRRGIGREIHAALDEMRRADRRTTVAGEVFVTDEPDGKAGMAFAQALGFGSVHEEDHLVLPLPADADRTSALGGGDGYEVVTWRGRCPDEYAEAYCRMRTQMARDVPVGELAYEPPVIDVARLRTGEERIARSYHQVVAAARRVADGEMGGYSVLFLAHDDHEVLQDDTLVMPGHRGRRLGTLLKLATLGVLQREHPDRRAVHTWTAPQNHAMYAINLAFGYVAAERMHEVQRADPR
ncbi:MAG TPA: GNAT family N-acetyltransferase [Nocardioides sp.]|nr:GNAT family N-acetyltransferase [Nocardioides sp.]